MTSSLISPAITAAVTRLAEILGTQVQGSGSIYEPRADYAARNWALVHPTVDPRRIIGSISLAITRPTQHGPLEVLLTVTRHNDPPTIDNPRPQESSVRFAWHLNASQYPRDARHLSQVARWTVARFPDLVDHLAIPDLTRGLAHATQQRLAQAALVITADKGPSAPPSILSSIELARAYGLHK